MIVPSCAIYRYEESTSRALQYGSCNHICKPVHMPKYGYSAHPWYRMLEYIASTVTCGNMLQMEYIVVVWDLGLL